MDGVQGPVAGVALEQERVVVAKLCLPPQRRKLPRQPQARAVLEERANKKTKRGTTTTAGPELAASSSVASSSATGSVPVFLLPRKLTVTVTVTTTVVVVVVVAVAVAVTATVAVTGTCRGDMFAGKGVGKTIPHLLPLFSVLPRELQLHL